MSEQQQEKLENAMPEAVENICDDRENAPSEKAEAVKQSKNKKNKKRKKKRGVPVGIVVILLVLVIVAGMFFGIVLGYGEKGPDADKQALAGIRPPAACRKPMSRSMN